jgi:hypothetical protein
MTSIDETKGTRVDGYDVLEGERKLLNTHASTFIAGLLRLEA